MSENKIVTQSTSITKATTNTPPLHPNSAQTQSAQTQSYRLPSDITLQHASKLSIVEDKPIMLDYWTQSIEKKSLIGVRENGEKLLVKSADEYTSPISKFYKSGTEYIVITENSIYIVSTDIPTKKIS